MDPRTIATNVRSIFSLPDVVIRVNDLIDSGEATNYELEQAILTDQALTAKVLRFANSTYFGFSGKVETVLKAISIMGHKELRNLVIASSVTSGDVRPPVTSRTALHRNTHTSPDGA